MMKKLRIILFHFAWVNCFFFIPHYLGKLVRYIDKEIINPSSYFDETLPDWIVGTSIIFIFIIIIVIGEVFRDRFIE